MASYPIIIILESTVIQSSKYSRLTLNVYKYLLAIQIRTEICEPKSGNQLLILDNCQVFRVNRMFGV